MGRIIVNVMPTSEAPGANAQAAMARIGELGYDEFTRVRIGRRFLLTVDGDVTDAHLLRARELGDQIAPEGFAVTAVHSEGETIVAGATDDDDWDIYEAGIGAMAPIPEGAGQHEGRRTAHHDIALDQHVEGFGTGVYTGEDD